MTNGVAGGRRATDGASHYGAVSALTSGVCATAAAGRSPAPVHSARLLAWCRDELPSFQGYFTPSNCAIAPHEATNLVDLEMLYLLEGLDALEASRASVAT